MYKALKSGKLVKPECCEECDEKTDKLDAHHHAGYEDRLNVTWLCKKCHRAETPDRSENKGCRGEKNFNAVLKEGDIAFIKSSKMTGLELADKFNVHPSTISRVRNSTSWRHV